MIRGRVVATKLLTPSVKWFRVFAFDRPKVNFKAGQWADVYIPGTQLVGGYSMCSAPIQFTESHTFDLAVKRSSWSPTIWMSEKCTVGTEFDLKFGGDVYYVPTQEATTDWETLLLIAGGVGINPLYSILLTYVESGDKRPLWLYYSASNMDELQFKNDIDKLVAKYENIHVKYFVTRSDRPSEETSSNIAARRIEASDFALLKNNLLNVYLCGPNNMMETLEGNLLNAGVDKSYIHYEKWW